MRLTWSGEPQIPRLVQDVEFSSEGGCELSFNFIKNQLSNCVQNHRPCRSYQDEMRKVLGGGWPRRILKINNRGSKIKLVEFQPAMEQKYVALSYCWGDQRKQFRAIASTLPALRKGVKVSQLPVTIKDAIKVSISLGIDLIWIDAMCIIQDDRADWKTEALKMATVYSNSLVTVIASEAKSCDQGFLSNKRNHSVVLGEVQVESKPVVIRGRVLRDWGHHRNGPQSPENYQHQCLDPVDTRGWILQERLLSSRYISFTSGEIQWGCQDCKVCECDQPLQQDLASTGSSDDQWFATVDEFSMRHLSERTDVLIALAGIAKRASTMLDGNWTWYAAGLWLEPQMSPLGARSLLWYRWSNLGPAYFPRVYTAPSFSWASVAGQVQTAGQIDAEGGDFPTAVVEVDMIRSTPDMFGHVEGGHMRLCGPLISSKLSLRVPGGVPDSQAKIDVMEPECLYVTTCFLDGPVERVSHPEGGFTVQRYRSENLEDSEKVRGEVHFDHADVFILPITADSRDLMKPGQMKESASGGALVLARAVSGQGYERIGMAQYTCSKLADLKSMSSSDIDLY
ncbi:hypothetical protein JX265_009189 [Neoarthrinium moseri]|uniref:Heterokaryon incompatibility domain-containing protein n=1 Tax=Neoarthrinium moseri TaxID=1658444 RepID=A0A9P9WGR5_9PEZI|nr:uncharacterized protein JN550_006645 [Neoarthrinium moseri]KAI1862475.1 hypothetical protein JX265_009189 [Neoarthrinium moseri]KAI1868157.1 hypothetical protein JN550_006645 [Neoarthrinium moseri]